MIKKLFLIAFLVGSTQGMFAMNIRDKINLHKKAEDPKIKERRIVEEGSNNQRREFRKQEERRKGNDRAERDARKRKKHQLKINKGYEKKESNRGLMPLDLEDSSSDD